MRIALVTDELSPGGRAATTRPTLDIAAQLARMGHRCTVVAAASRSERPASGEGPYADEGAWIRPVASEPADPARPWLQGKATEEDLVRILEEEGTDVVHVMQPLGLPRVFPAARRLTVPIVAHLVDYSYLCSLETLRRRDGSLCVGADDGRACASVCGVAAGPQRVDWGRSVLGSAEAVVSPSRFAIDVFASQGFDTTRWRQIPRGIDYAGRASRTSPPDGDVLRLGFLGPMVEQGGAHVLVEAIRLLDDARVELTVHGQVSGTDAYEARVRQLTAGDRRIRFQGAGGHDMPADRLATLHAVTIPSLWHENVPPVGLEAAAAGVPLIASDVGGIRELIEDHRCGFTFRAGSPESLAELLDRLLRRPAILEGVRARMAYPPSLEEEAFEIVRLYEEVAAEFPRQRRHRRLPLAGRWR